MNSFGLRSTRPPILVWLYLAALAVATGVTLLYAVREDPNGDPSFAGIYLILLTLPTAIPLGALLEPVGSGLVALVAFVAAGLFQAWLLWVFLDRRRQRNR